MIHKAPQGYISSGDVYNCKTNKILVDIPNHLKIVDDSLIYAQKFKEIYHSMIEFIQKCDKYSMVLNPEKFKFGVRETDFAGF